ncbi:hypothetical protein [Nonomuraea indica]|uniref:Uncharacterized protein n=1 Tax=Nonomuraea indica TaxID=1581193 RepID=A0ABW8AGE1_9ACTN
MRLRPALAAWNRNRAAVSSWFTWCTTKKRWVAPSVPGDVERSRETPDETKAVAKTTIRWLLSRRDVPLREKTLWRMLYETAAAPQRSSRSTSTTSTSKDAARRSDPKGGAIEWVYGDTGTALFLPRLLRLPDGTQRTRGPLFLSEWRPAPARRPAAADICPTAAGLAWATTAPASC